MNKEIPMLHFMRLFFGYILVFSIAYAAESSTTKPLLQSNNPRPKEAFLAYNGTTYIARSNETSPTPLQLANKKIPWIPHPEDSSQKIALVPISYHTKPGTLSLSPALTITIKPGNYKKEQITLLDSSKLKPDTKNTKRIAKERDEAVAIYATFNKKRYWNGSFAYPVGDIVTSPFGTARVFNNEVKSFHSGTDFRAPTGTPIYATNHGVVVLAKERFLAGNSVIIDHGEGIYSTYFHCSKILVQVGQVVQKGEKIALSGATGRVSGAHLHFGIVVYGTLVDPLDFITAVNDLLLNDTSSTRF